MGSASKNTEVVQAYLDKEAALGQIVGLTNPSPAPCGTQVSPIGVIPKQGKWRLIVDHSSPEGQSVDGGIEPELCSLHYLRLDKVVQQISKVGQGVLLAKMDIDSAYRNVPTHPADRPLLGMQWKGSIFFDTQLPFRLRSVSKIFSVMADALRWSFMERWNGGFNASHPTGNKRLRLLGLQSLLGIVVLAAEMGRSIFTVAYLSTKSCGYTSCIFGTVLAMRVPSVSL